METVWEFDTLPAVDTPVGVLPTGSTFCYSLLRQVFSPIIAPLNQWFGEVPDFKSFDEVISAATEMFGQHNVLSRALRAATSATTLDRAQIDSDSLAVLKDPLGTIEDRASIFAHTRLRPETWDCSDFSGAPMLETLRQISNPIEPPVSSDFHPTIHAAITRPSMRPLQSAVYALAQKNYSRGEALIVTFSAFATAASTHGIPAHLSETHHTGKPDDDLGRLLYDFTNLKNGTPINSVELKDVVKLQFGVLIHPRFSHFLQLYYRAKSHFPGRLIKFAKSDVSRAFHRFRWTATGSFLLAVRLSDEYVLLPITGGFGHTACPFIFGPVTNFIDWHHKHRMAKLGIPFSLSATYIDDSVSVGPDDPDLPFLQDEVAAGTSLLREVIADDAVNSAKDILSHTVDILGIRVNSIIEKVGLSYRSYLKLCYVLFVLLPSSVDTNTILPLKTVQCIASLFCRYGNFIPLLRYSASVFYMLLKGKFRPFRRLSKIQVDCIKLWRSVLSFAFFNSTVLSTSFIDVLQNDCVDVAGESAMNINATNYTVFTDSTLHTMGVFVPLRGWVSIHLDSLTNNTTDSYDIAHLELLALIIGFWFAKFLAPNEAKIHVFIDNQNALRWSQGLIKTSNPLSLSLSMFNCLLQTQLRTLQTRSYIASADNFNADAISRRKFANCDHLTQYFLSAQTLTFCQLLLKSHVSSPLDLAPQLRTTLESGAIFHS